MLQQLSQPPHSSLRVAVVGAGPSGLVTVKELLDEGHDPVCFERSIDLGGVYRFDEDAGVVWDSCRLTSSGLLTAFSDFPVPPDRREHMLAPEYRDYLANYASTFGLGGRIRFGMQVERVTPIPSGKWLLRVADTGGASAEEVFDAVAICTGQNQVPRVPDVPGLDRFQGVWMHGSRYRRPEQVRGQRVLVVGGGESGGDIAAEVSRYAVQTVLSLRRGVAVLPRRRHGWPNDFRTCRLNNSSAHWVFQTRHPADRWKRRVYTAAFLPVVIADKLVQVATSLVSGLREFVRQRGSTPGIEGVAVAWRASRVRRQLLRESGGTVAEQFGTKGDGFITALAAGHCHRVGAIDRFEGRRVIFDDGSDYQPDVVIFCTGFEPRVSCLERSLAPAPRFLHLLSPAIGTTLAFVGFVRPAHGAIPPVAELQARYFALLLSGKRQLPSLAEMNRTIEQQSATRRHLFRPIQGRLEQLVDFTSYCDDLADRIGCRPTRADVQAESLRFRFRFFAGPFVAAQYRLVGPHAKPAIARDVIGGLPVSHPKPMVALYYVRWRLTRLLHRLLGDEFAPKLALGSEVVSSR